MSAKNEAFITPAVMKWGRERARITQAKVAKKTGVGTHIVVAWEGGDKRPTFPQAKKLAQALYLPFGYLFLTEPPADALPLQDFRTVGSVPAVTSANLVDFVKEVIFKHRWYREHLIEEGAKELPFVGRYRTLENPEEVAGDIGAVLGLDDSKRREFSSSEEFHLGLIRMAEANRILVMRNRFVGGNRNRSIGVEEFRGFAISDSIAPLICINSDDAKAAQIFTIAHELAHIWVGQTGISSQGLETPPSSNNVSIERFCNAVAAELLVPRSGILTIWDERQDVGTNVNAVRLRFRVSLLVALRRAFDLEKMSLKEYRDRYSKEMARIVAKAAKVKDEKDASGNPFNNLVSRNGLPFTEALVGAVKEGRLAYRDAAAMLSIKVDTIHKLGDHLMSSR